MSLDVRGNLYLNLALALFAPTSVNYLVTMSISESINVDFLAWHFWGLGIVPLLIVLACLVAWRRVEEKYPHRQPGPYLVLALSLCAPTCIYYVSFTALSDEVDLTLSQWHTWAYFVFPVLGVAFCLNVWRNLVQGREMFALPKLFHHVFRRRVRRWLNRLYVSLVFIHGAILIFLHAYVVPALAADPVNPPLGSVIKGILHNLGAGSSSELTALVSSQYWAVFLSIAAINAVYIAARAHNESEQQELMYSLYRTLAGHAVDLCRRNDGGAKKDVPRHLLSSMTKIVYQSATCGWLTRFYNFATRPVFTRLLYVAWKYDDESQSRLTCTDWACEYPDHQPAVAQVAASHRPALLQIKELENLFESHIRKGQNDEEFLDCEKFLDDKEDLHSGCGATIALGQAKIYNSSWQCMALSQRHLEWQFKSCVMLPIKSAGRILGVILIGSSQQQSFERRSLRYLERLSHVIGEGLEMIDRHCQLCSSYEGEVSGSTKKSPGNDIVDLTGSQPYPHRDERRQVRRVLKVMARTVRRSGKLDEEAKGLVQRIRQRNEARSMPDDQYQKL